MAYTVNDAYNIVLQEADKMGSDYFPLPAVLARFKTEALDFVGKRAAEVEITQQVTDDIRQLVTLQQITTTVNADEAQCYNAALPLNYHTRFNVKVQYSDGTSADRPTLERIGEHNHNMQDPFKKPTKAYPLVMQMSDFFKIYTGGAVATKLWLTYLKRPTFGVNGGDTVVNLSDDAVEDILKKTAAALHMVTGDPRAPMEIQVNQLSRKP